MHFEKGKGIWYRVTVEHPSLPVTIGPVLSTLQTVSCCSSDAKCPPNCTTGGFPGLERILSWHRAFLSTNRESKFYKHIFQPVSHTNCLNSLGELNIRHSRMFRGRKWMRVFQSTLLSLTHAVPNKSSSIPGQKP